MRTKAEALRDKAKRDEWYAEHLGQLMGGSPWEVTEDKPKAGGQPAVIEHLHTGKIELHPLDAPYWSEQSKDRRMSRFQKWIIAIVIMVLVVPFLLRLAAIPFALYIVHQQKTELGAKAISGTDYPPLAPFPRKK